MAYPWRIIINGPLVGESLWLKSPMFRRKGGRFPIPFHHQSLTDAGLARGIGGGYSFLDPWDRDVEMTVRHQIFNIFYVILFNLPGCYLGYEMVARKATGDLRHDIEASDRTERFFMNWLAVNVVISMAGMAALCVSPRLRCLVFDTDQPYSREAIVCFFGSATCGLLGMWALRYFSM